MGFLLKGKLHNFFELCNFDSIDKKKFQFFFLAAIHYYCSIWMAWLNGFWKLIMDLASIYDFIRFELIMRSMGYVLNDALMVMETFKWLWLKCVFFTMGSGLIGYIESVIHEKFHYTLVFFSCPFFIFFFQFQMQIN